MTQEIKATLHLLDKILAGYEKVLKSCPDELPEVKVRMDVQVKTVKICIEAIEDYWTIKDGINFLEEKGTIIL